MYSSYVIIIVVCWAIGIKLVSRVSWREYNNK